MRKTLILAGLFLLAFAATIHAQDDPQALYLKASKMIRDGDYASARVLLERVLDEFPAADIALKADEKLSEILDQAKAQQRERMFRAGPGLYVVLKSGESTPIQAYRATFNNLAAESGNAEDGFVRALSEKTNYPIFVMTDIAKAVLFTPAQDMSVFRAERIASDFPYHRVVDAGPLGFSQTEPEVYEVDLGFLSDGRVDRNGNCIGAVSCPPDLGVEAMFVSQATGTWGTAPGPVERIVWPMKILANYREFLAQTAYGDLDRRIEMATAALERQSEDASIEWYIAERYGEKGDRAAYLEWSHKQLDKATALNQTSVASIAQSHIVYGEALEEMASLAAAGAELQPDPALFTKLEKWSDQYESHVAFYLMSILKEREGDYKQAEEYAKQAEKKTKKEQPRLVYCSVVDDPGLELKKLYDTTKKYYKTRKDEMKKLKKEHDQ